MKRNIFLIVVLVLVLAFAACTKTEQPEEPVATEATAESADDEHALSDDNYHETIENTEGVVIVDFWAEWCPPCLELGPILEELSETEEIPLYKVNVDYAPNLSVEFEIQYIPTVLIYNNGELVDTRVGVGARQDYLDIINSYR